MSDIYLMSVFQGGGAGCIGGFVSQAVKVTEGEAVFSGESRVGPVFTGKELDEFSGLNYFGARYYDPDVAMWMSVDPMRQFWSPYSYAGNGHNPINGVDPDGNSKTKGITHGNDPFLLELKDAAQKNDRKAIQEIFKRGEAMKNAKKMSPERWKNLKAWYKLAKDGRILKIANPLAVGLTTLDTMCNQDPAGCVMLLEEMGDINEPLPELNPDLRPEDLEFDIEDYEFEETIEDE
jgi:RHS repeat-associated protein